MSNNPAPEESDSLFELINGTVGKITVFVTFITSIFTALKLIRGDTRLAIVILFFFGTGVLWLVSLYLFLKKTTKRTMTVRHGVQVDVHYAYGKKRYAALAVIVFISILWLFSIVYHKRTQHGSTVDLLQALTGEKVTVTGFVLTAGGEPADKAFVTLLLNDKTAGTQEAPDGKFNFTNIDISDLKSGPMRIQAKWRTLESPPQNLSMDQLTNVLIKLPPGPTPFKVDYFVLEGPAMDFLAQGRMDSSWEARLGGQPTIIGNDVFVDLKDLMDRFSEPPSFETFVVSKSSGKPRSQPREVKTLVATANWRLFLGGNEPSLLYRPLTSEEFGSLLGPTQKWHLVITPSRYSIPPAETLLPGINVASFFFWRFASPDDAKMVLQGHRGSKTDKTYAFYSYITREDAPSDFFIFTMQPSLDRGCGEETTGVALRTRSLRLRVALLENVSDNNIRIGKFTIQENGSHRLRTRENDASLLNAKAREQKTFYPSEVLKPKDKLVIPVELLLANSSVSLDGERNYVKGTPAEVANELRKVTKINLPVGRRPTSPIEADASVLLNFLSTPSENPKLTTEFVYGASLKIESLDVDGISYPFRPLDTGVVVMKGGFQTASCPFVLTYAPESKRWINEGTILVNRNSKSKEGTDEKELTHFDGSIVLEEKDPETSFVDKLYIRAVNVNGVETLLFPKNPQLLYSDGNYLTLKHGDQKRIDFNIPEGLRATQFILVANGYYSPTPNRK